VGASSSSRYKKIVILDASVFIRKFASSKKNVAPNCRGQQFFAPGNLLRSGVSQIIFYAPICLAALAPHFAALNFFVRVGEK
jgi:hypothetical protein